MIAGGSAHAHAAALRAQARRGLWRRVLAWLGYTGHTRRADAAAARWGLGADAEQTTARMLEALQAQGWHIRHDMQLPGYKANYDHVLASPCGTALVVLDTKRWHRAQPTHLARGRVHCGPQDRHGQIEAVARYAARIHRALAIPNVRVWPLLVIHGSPITGGRLEASAPDWPGPVHVLGPDWLVPTLASAPRRRDPRAAAVLARRMDQVLRPYTGT